MNRFKSFPKQESMYEDEPRKDVLDGLPPIEVMIDQLKRDQEHRLIMMNKDPETKHFMPKD